MIPTRYVYDTICDIRGNPVEKIRVGEIRTGMDGEYIVWYA